MLFAALNAPSAKLYSLVLYEVQSALPLAQKIALPLIRTHPGEEAQPK